MKRFQFLLLFTLGTALLISCGSKRKKSNTLFSEIPSTESGVTFSNIVKQHGDHNVLSYPYFYNGGGVAIGDINNDGLADIYFSGNDVSNKLYLNKGDLHFEDITESAGMSVAEGWKTGVNMADVNQDGLLDIYVCRSGMYDSVKRENLLFINNGNLTFTERAKEFGINDNSYSTHSAFFDYDRDGDVDLFILNHSLSKYAGFNRLLVSYRNQKAPQFGSKLFQNNSGKFTDVSASAGLVNNLLSFGLGVAVSDLNMDGWPDLYVSNDFNEEDYLYLNNKNGTFTNVIKNATGHVSLFSMGSDIADVNNDGLPDIMTLDMLPQSNERIKLSSGDDNYDKYKILVDAGFHHQSMRNMLQLNNGDGTFSEIGQLAGVSNTDWSWSALFADYDGDGNKDLFISNGYEKDYTNMQFLKFTVDEQLKARQTKTNPDIEYILNKMPSINVGNYLFKNNGDLTFTAKNSEWGLSRNFKSNGAAYADLDNDGDPDLVINCMNETAAIYQNRSVEDFGAKFLTVDLIKENPHVNIIGTSLTVFSKTKSQYYEFMPTRGFQSGMYVPLQIGIKDAEAVDSIRINWPDGRTELIKNVDTHKTLYPKYSTSLSLETLPYIKKTVFESDPNYLNWKHVTSQENDFKKQSLLPKLFSHTGPKIAIADVDNDGATDFYICGRVGQPGRFFSSHSKDQRLGRVIDLQSLCQDEDALFFDADNDEDLDLYVVSGGYSAEDNSSVFQDRLYLNDGKAAFKKSESLPKESSSGSVVVAFDLENDGDQDLFVGSRFMPGQYPVLPESLLMINEGKGNFKIGSAEQYSDIIRAGMVTDALAFDVNKDSYQDLIVVGEWTGIRVLINNAGKLVDQTKDFISFPANGWWNRIEGEDFDNDGDLDLIIGNYGLNNQFKVSPALPAHLVYKDFNNDGQIDPFFCYSVNGVEFPYASRDEALSQVTTLKPKFVDYNAYANATMEKMFSAEDLQRAEKLTATNLETVYLENVNGQFRPKRLPIQCQFSPIHAIAVLDFNSDGFKDVILAGNESQVRVRIGKSDANYGLLLQNDGHGNFQVVTQEVSGLNLKGDVRDLKVIHGDKTRIIAGVMGDSIKTFILHQ